MKLYLTRVYSILLLQVTVARFGLNVHVAALRELTRASKRTLTLNYEVDIQTMHSKSLLAIQHGLNALVSVWSGAHLYRHIKGAARASPLAMHLHHFHPSIHSRGEPRSSPNQGRELLSTEHATPRTHAGGAYRDECEPFLAILRDNKELLVIDIITARNSIPEG